MKEPTYAVPVDRFPGYSVPKPSKELQVEPIRTHGLAIFWHEHGCPNRKGQEITVAMQSGRNAVFKLTNIERATGVDWNWYDLAFVRYAQKKLMVKGRAATITRTK